ncbi:cytochrome c maturation protein CcmE [Desulfovibrio aminophilus]|nr:cytochrome c maturation protein CcmE [Desulfovibrio aminophilus]MCM0756745.1 cytochrome c maturation protein CcmE [Desulfovibrio aminophilus]
MTRTKSNKIVYLVALFLFLGGLGWLVLSGISEDSVYFLNVSEALALEPAKREQARLFGSVDAADLRADAQSLGVSFNLLDKFDHSKSIRVNYRGAVPDTFKPGAEVIVEGRFDKADGAFTANTLITKCPSKYKKKSEEAQG